MMAAIHGMAVVAASVGLAEASIVTNPAAVTDPMSPTNSTNSTYPMKLTADAPQMTVNTLPGVRVYGVAFDEQHVPGARVVISGTALERAGNLADVVRYQPLVSAPGTATGARRNQSRFDRGGTTGYNIRGIEGNRIGLDVDGIEMPDAVDRAATSGAGRAAQGSFGMGRDFIDPDSYAEVDIESGTTGPSRPAGGIGGAVSFRTKSPEDYVGPGKPAYFGAALGVDTSDRSWKKNITSAGQAGAASGLLSYTRRDGHEQKNFGGAVHSYPAQWDSDALLLKGGYMVSPTQKLEVSADIYRRHDAAQFDNWNTALTAMESRSRQHARTARETLQVRHLWTPVSGIFDYADTRVYSQTTDMRDKTDTRLNMSEAGFTELSQNKTQTVGMSSAIDKTIGVHRLGFGVNVSQSDTQHPLQLQLDENRPYPDTRTQRVGAFVEDQMVFHAGGKRLAVIPGIRVDHITSTIRHAGDFNHSRINEGQLRSMYDKTPRTTLVSPSLSVMYDVMPRLSLYAQYRHGGRAPGVNDLFGFWQGGGPFYALIGNPGLRKETSNAFDIGLKGSPAAGVTLNSSLFYTRYKDFIAYTRFTRLRTPELFTHLPGRFSTVYRADNRDHASIYGLEFSVRLDHGHWASALEGFYTTWAAGYSRGRAKSYYAGDKDVELASVAPPKAIIGVGYDAPQKLWGVNVTGTFVRGKRAQSTARNAFGNNAGETLAQDNTALMRVPGYARFDLSGYWRMNKRIHLQAGVYNFTNTRYWDYASVRDLQVGVRSDQYARQLLSSPGRSYMMSMSMVF